MSLEDIDIEMIEVEERMTDLMRRYKFLKTERIWTIEEIEKEHEPL